MERSRVKRWGALGLLAGVVMHAGSARAQTWVQQSPFPTAQHIYDLAFPTADRGFVVGTWRALVETQDAGATWVTRMSGGLASDPFYRITFPDPQHGYIFGNNDDAWRTTNGGTNWTRMTSMLSGSWYYADFVSPTLGVAGCNGAGASTSDGGVTWNLLQGWPDSPFYHSIDMRDASVGLASGYVDSQFGAHGILRTTNGGASWSLVRDGAAGQVMWLDQNTAIAFIDDGVHGTRIDRSIDAGLTWQAWGACGAAVLDKAARVDGDVLVGVVHAVGTVFRSSDGARTWKKVMDGQGVGGLPAMAPWSFSFPDPDHGYLGGPNGMLFRSLDRGQTWTQLSRGIGEEIAGLDMATSRVGYAVTGFHTLKTTNGGANWRIVHMPKVTGQVFGRDERGTCISVVDEDFAVVAGQGGIAFRTRDGGATWDSIGWPDGLTDIFNAADVRFIDRNNGWVVGNGDQYGMYPSAYRTSDGGDTWTPAPASLPNAYFSCVEFSDAMRGWIGVGSNVIFRTVDGGQTWARIDINASFLSVTDISFAPGGMVGYLTGFYGEVFRTTNGGITWTPVVFDPNYNERATSISVVSPREAYYTAYDNSANSYFTKYTTNSGVTWTKSAYPAAWKSAYLLPSKIEVLGSGRAFVGGYNGIIASTVLPRCIADFNRDGFVNGNDYDEFSVVFDEAGPAADLNGDGFVNGNDYDEFANVFDTGC